MALSAIVSDERRIECARGQTRKQAPKNSGQKT
jgi:hypothetical protein